MPAQHSIGTAKPPSPPEEPEGREKPTLPQPLDPFYEHIIEVETPRHQRASAASPNPRGLGGPGEHLNPCTDENKPERCSEEDQFAAQVTGGDPVPYRMEDFDPIRPERLLERSDWCLKAINEGKLGGTSRALADDFLKLRAAYMRTD